MIVFVLLHKLTLALVWTESQTCSCVGRDDSVLDWGCHGGEMSVSLSGLCFQSEGKRGIKMSWIPA